MDDQNLSLQNREHQFTFHLRCWHSKAMMVSNLTFGVVELFSIQCSMEKFHFEIQQKKNSIPKF